MNINKKRCIAVKKRNKLILGITGGVLIAAALLICFFVYADDYALMNTYALVDYSYAADPDTPELKRETPQKAVVLKKYDTIKTGDVILSVTDIDGERSITFSVDQGKLYDTSGEEIKSVTFYGSERKEFKTQKGTALLYVIEIYML